MHFEPLILIDPSSGKILLLNNKPGSSRLSRPLKIRRTKETNEVIKKVNEKDIKEIKNLRAYSLGDVTVAFTVKTTCGDGKVRASYFGTF